MSEITIAPIPDKTFGAIVTEVALATLTDVQFSTIQRAFLKYGFLVFPNQHLSDAENIAFGERFGKLEFAAMPMANQEKRPNSGFSPGLPIRSVPD